MCISTVLSCLKEYKVMIVIALINTLVFWGWFPTEFNKVLLFFIFYLFIYFFLGEHSCLINYKQNMTTTWKDISQYISSVNMCFLKSVSLQYFEQYIYCHKSVSYTVYLPVSIRGSEIFGCLLKRPSHCNLLWRRRKYRLKKNMYITWAMARRQ